MPSDSLSGHGGPIYSAALTGTLPRLEISPLSSLVAQRLKHLPPTRETWVQSLGLEDPLEKGMVTNIYFCFIDYAKAFDCMDHNKRWKILKEMGITDRLTCLLRNLYAGQVV